MILLPAVSDMADHAPHLTGVDLSLMQDRPGAIRIEAYCTIEKERRHYHVLTDEGGSITRIEPCKPVGTMPDGKPDYRPPLPFHHPDLSYDVAAMLCIVHSMLAETGLANIAFLTDYENTMGDRRFTSNFIARRRKANGDPLSITRREEYHIPKAALLSSIGSTIANHLGLSISDDGYGGNLTAHMDGKKIDILYDSDDGETGAGFRIVSAMKNGAWEHTTHLFCKAPADPVSRMHALREPLETFEQIVEEHENLTCVIPTDSSAHLGSEIDDSGDLVISIEPGLIWGRDEDQIIG